MSSKIVDSRVVEMRFDNSHFEKNVATSMSTLEKLKSKLNLSGATKGLENLGSAAKHIDLSGLAGSIATIESRFSSLGVVGVTVLSNITNAAINAGKRMVSALTIDPVKMGFSEYETKINSIQTIMSNTASKGTTMADVTRVIDELNTYADKTIYNFAEMTRNIGTFTAAGVGLEESAAAIQGIANLAAASGSTSQQASTAMYQLSQALAAGTVKLMDWNSVVNAGMGGEKFQEALKATAREHGIAVDAMIKENGSFRESLREGWISADILNETLNKFTVNGAKKYAESMLTAGKYTQEQADALIKEAQSMEDAATKVKTFTQLWDTLKESAQSGWGKTWEIIIGDFEEAKELFSELSGFLGGFIDKMSDSRNNLIEGALSSPFGKLAEKIESVTGAAKAVGEAVEKIKDYEEIVNRIMMGEFGDGQNRWDKLTEMGYDWAKAQNMVNEQLNCSTRYEEQATEAQTELAEVQAITIDQLAEMSDAQLKNLNFTEEEIKALRELADEAERTNVPLSELIEKMNKKDGRTLLIESFKNAGQGLVAILKSIGQAWTNIFPPMTSAQLYSAIEAVNSFSQHLIVSDETAAKLRRTFEGLFAALDIVTTIAGGGLKIAFKAVSEILSYFNMDILDATAALGDAIVGVRDWIDSMLDFSGIFDKILPNLQGFAESIKGWFEGLKTTDNIGQYIVDGLVTGIKNAYNAAVSALVELATSMYNAFCSFFGINSPSTLMIAAGGFIIAGLIIGLLTAFPEVLETIKSIASSMWETLQNGLGTASDFVKKIDFDKVFAAGISVAMLAIIKKIGDALSSLSSPLEGIGDLAESLGTLAKSRAWKNKAGAIKEVAIALAIVAAAFVALTFVDSTKLEQAGIILLKLATLLTVLYTVSALMSKASLNISKEGIGINGIKTSLLAIASAVMILALVVKLIGSMNADEAERGFTMLSNLVFAAGTIMLACRLLSEGASEGDMKEVGKTLQRIAVAMLLLVAVAKIIAGMSWPDIGKAAVGIAGLTVIVGLLTAMTQKNNPFKTGQMGSMLLGVAAAFAILVVVGKIIARMEWPDMGKATIGLVGLSLIVGLLVKVTKVASGTEVAKIGGTIAGIGAAMLMLVVVGKILAKMEWGDMAKAAAGLLGMTVIIGLLVAITRIAGDKAPKISLTLLAMSVAIGILAAVSVMLSMMSVEGLVKGITAVGLLSTFVSLMVASTKGAEKCIGNLVVLAVIIALLTGAVAALSNIPVEDLAKSTLAISAVMGMCALMINSTKSLKDVKMGPLLAMIGVIAGVAAAIWALTKFGDMSTAIEAASSISLVLIALSAAFKIMNGSNVSFVDVGILAVMALVVGEIGLILGALQALNIQPSLETAASLSILLLALTAATNMLVGVGPFAALALAGAGALVGVIAIIGGVLTGLGYLAGLMDDETFAKVETGLDRIGVIFEKLGVMVGKLVGGVFEGFEETAFAGLEKLAQDLTKFSDNLAGFDATKATEAIDALGKLVTASIFTNGQADWSKSIFGDNSLDAFGRQLPVLGTRLGKFCENLGEFDADAAIGAVKAVADMADAAKSIDGQADWSKSIFGDNSLDAFGRQLPVLGTRLSTFCTNLGEFNGGKAISAMKTVAGMVEAAKGIDGQTQAGKDIFGDNSLDAFGRQLPVLGTRLGAFCENLGQFNSEIATSAIQALADMATAASKIPNTGGAIAELFGDNGIAAFSSQFPSLGVYLKYFSTNLEGFDSTTVTGAVDALVDMATAASKIPNTGGKIADLFGDNSLASFADQFPDLGMHLATFSANLAGFDKQAATDAIDAIADMAKTAEGINGQADWAAKIFGENGIAAFSGDLVEFSEDVSQIDTGAITRAIVYMNNIIDVSKMSENVDATHLANFETAAIDLAYTMKNYSDVVASLDTGVVTNSVSNAKRIVGIVNELASLDTSGIKSFKEAVNSLGEVSLDNFVEAFNGAAKRLDTSGKNLVDALVSGFRSKQDSVIEMVNAIISKITSLLTSKNVTFRQAGVSMIAALAEGIASQSSRVKDAVSATVNSATSGLRDQYSEFYSIGSYLAEGLAGGISSKIETVAARATGMVTTAIRAAKEAAGINSPSRVFYELGEFTGLGFVNALDDYASKAYRTASNLAISAKSGLADTISNIASVIDGDMDIQPTIRPVLDLSDVRSGVSSISGMLNGRSSLGVMANIGAISSSMARRNQNGVNDDVVSAINKLRKDLPNMGGTTYSINGITYDDGSNIASAIKTITRHVKIEGRV